MTTAAPPYTEADRLALLQSTRLLDSEGSPAFDALARMAARQTDCPVAAINLVDAHRLFALARHGLHQRHLGREGSFCDQTLASTDVHIATLPPQDAAGIVWRFYAGMAIVVEGMPLGTVCVMDREPKAFDTHARAALRDTALAAASVIQAELTALRLRRQEARVRTASMAGSDWLWETDKDGRIQWVSSGLLRHTGIDPMAELGMHTSDFYAPRNDGTQASWERYLQACRRHEPFSDAIAERDTPHGRIAVSISGTPVFDSAGQFMGYRGASRNVTRQLAIDNQVRHDEQLLRQAFDSFHAGVMIANPQGRVIYANQHWRARTGVDDISTLPPWPELLRQRIARGHYRDAVGREEDFYQWRLNVVNGTDPVVLHMGDLVALCRDVRLPDGSIAYFSTDITHAYNDRKRLHAQKEALAQSEERWKFALEGNGDGVWDWEIGRPEVFLAPRWKTMIGFEDSEMGNEPNEWVSRVHPEDRQQVFSSFIDYCHTGRGIFQSEFRMRHKEGHDVWILSRGKVVQHAPDGRPLRIVGTHSDITVLKQAERALRDKQIAEAANRAKSEFLSRMSHEVRTPLNAIRGFTQLLVQRQTMGGGATGDSTDYLHQILLSTELLSELVDDVLDLQQIEAGAMSISREAVPLDDVVHQCTAMLALLATRYQVLIDNQVEASVRVLADRRRLQQVLSNLLSNAIKYNRPQGVVRLSLSPAHAPGQHTLCVEDTGPGLNAGQLARLFQPFERLGQDTSQIEGTGLGLIITRSLTEAMGGRLEIRSQTGAGTRVYVTLPSADNDQEMTDNKDTAPIGAPITADMAEPARASAAAHACTADAPLRVVYVEDNRINALLFQEALRPYPELWLEVAEDGQMALTVAREHQPEVLVIDAHLPGMSGFEVLRALRTLPGLTDVPAYMCSADALPEDIQRAHEEGFVGYWTKPIDIEHVTAELLRLARQGRPDVA
jgi:PAS domain S-box-containing protein